MKAIVVAVDRKHGIGAANDLLWHTDLPDDLRHFKQITTGGTITMGRNTFESIGRALPNRENIVVTSRPLASSGVTIVSGLDEAYQKATGEVYVIGGGKVYAAAINDMDVLYVTEVDAEFPEAEIFFPDIDETIWQEVIREHHEKDEKNKYNFDFVQYCRR